MAQHVFSPDDHRFMARALQLARLGLYTTSPNPRVGCLIVRQGQIVGEGYHVRAGEAHAEIIALAAAGSAARGATAYVTLEPCSHTGKTPPCVESLIDAGVRRVVGASSDPNPQVNGRGFERLRAAGIEVACGLLAGEARELNPGFFSRMERGRPWLRLKTAASLDGGTALANGASQWITSQPARTDGHRFRARACAILTGIGTVAHDDPELSVRLPPDEAPSPARAPLKIIVDPKLALSPQARLLSGGPVLVATGSTDAARIDPLRDRGVEILLLPLDAADRLDLSILLESLAERGINEVHVEAGRRLNGGLVEAGLVDEFLFYFAPTLLGDSAQGMFGWPALEKLTGQRRLTIADLRRVGDDIRLIARLTPIDTVLHPINRLP